MFAYLSGKITHRTPTAIHLDVNGVGYDIQISLNTYSEIESKDEVKLFTHLYMREDIHTILLYGFCTMVEKDLFLMLNTFKKVKGIGGKTADRLILDLKDKITRLATDEELKEISKTPIGSSSEEAISALVSLGFQKAKAEKAVSSVSSPGAKLEDLVKDALKLLT